MALTSLLKFRGSIYCCFRSRSEAKPFVRDYRVTEEMVLEVGHNDRLHLFAYSVNKADRLTVIERVRLGSFLIDAGDV